MSILGGKQYFKCLLVIASSLIALILVFQISPTKYDQMKIFSNKEVLKDNNYENDDINRSFSLSSSRGKYLSLSLDGFKEKPIFGHGFGNFRNNTQIFDLEGNHIRSPVTHNDYFQLLYEQGLLGFISFVYLFLFNITRIRKIGNGARDQSTIMFSQLILVAVSLNAVNLLDHPIFWILMSLTLVKKDLLKI